MPVVIGVALIGALDIFLEALAAVAFMSAAFAIIAIVLATAVFVLALYGMISTTIRSRGRASWVWLGFIFGGSILACLPSVAVYGLLGGHTELTTNHISGVAQAMIFLCFFWWVADMIGMFLLYSYCLGVAADMAEPKVATTAQPPMQSSADPTARHRALFVQAARRQEWSLRGRQMSLTDLTNLWADVFERHTNIPQYETLEDMFLTFCQAMSELGRPLSSAQREEVWRDCCQSGTGA
jgi:hypothetical protein